MRILNYGSLNLDFDYYLEHIVMPGETISSQQLEICPGGKGLNQSIALARAGAEVWHAGMIGGDGQMLKALCEENGVNTQFLRTIGERTGNAIIQISAEGQNSIILYGGANQMNSREFVDEVLEEFGKGDVLLLQNEVNELPYMISQGYKKGMQIVLNPSPFNEIITECDLSKVSMILINEIEGYQMTGREDPEEILNTIAQEYPELKVVLTLGEKGAVFMSGEERVFCPARSVKAVDTTAAGDTFTGYFLEEYLSGGNAEKALQMATLAASVAVTRKGASASIPWKNEVK